MARGTHLQTHDLKRIAVAAGCDERSVARALLGVPGFGPHKAEKFGAEFLRVIAAHA